VTGAVIVGPASTWGRIHAYDGAYPGAGRIAPQRTRRPAALFTPPTGNRHDFDRPLLGIVARRGRQVRLYDLAESELRAERPFGRSGSVFALRDLPVGGYRRGAVRQHDGQRHAGPAHEADRVRPVPL